MIEHPVEEALLALPSIVAVGLENVIVDFSEEDLGNKTVAISIATSTSPSGEDATFNRDTTELTLGCACKGYTVLDKLRRDLRAWHNNKQAFQVAGAELTVFKIRCESLAALELVEDEETVYMLVASFTVTHDTNIPVGTANGD